MQRCSGGTKGSGDDVEGSFSALDGLVKQAFEEAFKATDDAFIKDSEHPQVGSLVVYKLSVKFACWGLSSSRHSRRRSRPLRTHSSRTRGTRR